MKKLVEMSKEELEFECERLNTYFRCHAFCRDHKEELLSLQGDKADTDVIMLKPVDSDELISTGIKFSEVAATDY